jgi:hypothetical protein
MAVPGVGMPPTSRNLLGPVDSHTLSGFKDQNSSSLAGPQPLPLDLPSTVSHSGSPQQLREHRVTMVFPETPDLKRPSGG